MTSRLLGLALVLSLGYLGNVVYSIHRRAAVFARQGVVQPLVIAEHRESELVTLFPPRFRHIYNARLGTADAVVETARQLATGQSYVVRYLRNGVDTPADALAGRTDRLVPASGVGQPIWFAFASGEDSTASDLIADLPWPETGFHVGWLLALLGGFLAESGASRAGRASRVHPMLREPVAPPPAPGPASTRIVMPSKPQPTVPPQPGPERVEQSPSLSLQRRMVGGKPVAETPKPDAPA